MDHVSTQMRLTVPLTAYRPIQRHDISFAQMGTADGSTSKLQQFPELISALSAAGTSCVRERGFVTHRQVRSELSLSLTLLLTVAVTELLGAQIIRHLDVLCTSFELILRELRLLWVKHPLQVVITPDGSLHITATLLIRPKSKPGLKAKVLVDFGLSREAMGYWPTHISATGVEAEVAYGPVQ